MVKQMRLIFNLLGEGLGRRFARQLGFQYVKVLGLGKGAEEEKLMESIECIDGHELGI